MSDDRLELLRELEQADEAVAAELTEVDELYAAVEELRGRALELAELHGCAPGATGSRSGGRPRGRARGR